MSDPQISEVMELSAFPELSGLHPDDVASLAQRVEWPREEGAARVDGEDASDDVQLLLSGRAAAGEGGPSFEAPALVGALEALAGVRAPGRLQGSGARIARLSRSHFRSLLADVFEVWLAMLRHGMGRLLVVESDTSEPLPGDRRAPQPGEAGLGQRIRLLTGCEFLGDLRVHTLGRLARGMEERRLEAGVPLWEESGAASHCFLVLEGSFAQGSGRWAERPLATPTGVVLGLRQVLADTRHTNRVVATDAGRVLCLPREHLIDELEDDPEAAEALLAAVARRALRAETAAR